MFPLEIIYLIILFTDFETSITVGNEYTSKKLYNPQNHTWNLAAKNGHLKVIEWLHKNKKEGCTTDAMDGAAMNGHLEMVEWFHNNRNEGCTTRAMYLAIINGHLEVAQFIFDNRI
jgi:hypothetical protein